MEKWYSEMQDADDAVSVNLHVAALRSQSYDPILYYKPVGILDPDQGALKVSDFALIYQVRTTRRPSCIRPLQDKALHGNNAFFIDSTHGTYIHTYIPKYGHP